MKLGGGHFGISILFLGFLVFGGRGLAFVVRCNAPTVRCVAVVYLLDSTASRDTLFRKMQDIHWRTSSFCVRDRPCLSKSFHFLSHSLLLRLFIPCWEGGG